MLKTLLIDDETACLTRLGLLLKHYCSATVEVVGQCQTVDDGLAAIDLQQPDLVFLDVELGHKTGFDLLGGVPLIHFDLVFCTAHDTYALRAFQADAVDYLLKPIDPDKLVRAVGKVLARSPKDRTEHHHQLTRTLAQQDRPISRIGIPDGQGLRYIDLDEVVCCESDGGYTHFYGKNKRTGKKSDNRLATASRPLKEFEEVLANSNFCRIHASCMINLAYLENYINGRGGEVWMADGTRLIVSNGYKPAFLRRIKPGI